MISSRTCNYRFSINKEGGLVINYDEDSFTADREHKTFVVPMEDTRRLNEFLEVASSSRKRFAERKRKTKENN